jgi:predicted  nucleic acid-binding Zn-ribbon protein
MEKENGKATLVNKYYFWEQLLLSLINLMCDKQNMNVFTLMIGGAALFIAGCAAYFSVRGIALTFGAVSSFTIPIIVMASSLEFGKLIAASFLYRNWHSCNKTLRTYLLLAVFLLIGITSAGIYGYLSQAFEQTINQVEGYEKEIASLQRQQVEYDRLIDAYKMSGKKGSLLREEKQTEERARLEDYIKERRADIGSAEEAKTRLAEETDQMIVGVRERREDEKKRIEDFIESRRKDISLLESQKLPYKLETDQRINSELAKEEKINLRIAQLDEVVKAYQDKGAGGFLKEDGFKKAAQLLKTQSEERDGLRASLQSITEAAQKARDDLEKRYGGLDGRIVQAQNEIAEANTKITTLTTGGAEQADNVKTALENLQQARSSVDERIKSLENEMGEASRKITSLSESGSVFGPESSAELEAKKTELFAKKEEAENTILNLDSKIRSTDIGSFKFIARAFDTSVAEAEETENPLIIEEAMAKAVNRVVKWFILLLVVVFDPLAVTLVVAYNASLLRGKNPIPIDVAVENASKNSFFSMGNLIILIVIIGLPGWFLYEKFGPQQVDDPGKIAKASFLSKLSSRKFDDRAFAYVPEKAFGVFSFSGLRMVEQVGLPKIIADDFLENIPFLSNLSWEPEECGVNPYGRVLYYLKFPNEDFIEKRQQDIAWGLIIPIGDQDRLREFILRKLKLKGSSTSWQIEESNSPSFISFHHRTSHISLGMDDQCLVILSSWSDQSDPEFLADELTQIFSYGQNSTITNSVVANKLTGDDYDVGLSLNGKNFFESFTKNGKEDELFENFRDFVSFDLDLKAKVQMDRVSLEGVYEYENGVLDSGFGIHVASKLDQIREGESSMSLDSVYGEFLEIFLQRLDFQTASNLIERIDLSQTIGFEQFTDLKATSRIRGKQNGTISMVLNTTESGGGALCSLVDLLVAALNPFPAPSLDN